MPASLFGGAMVLWLARATSGREVVGSSPLAAGCRAATVGHLHPGPGLTQPSVLSGSLNEYRL